MQIDYKCIITAEIISSSFAFVVDNASQEISNVIFSSNRKDISIAWVRKVYTSYELIHNLLNGLVTPDSCNLAQVYTILDP